MFDRLGDRVRFWSTLNEPWCIAYGGYVAGVLAPGAKNETWGYRVGHNLLRAHGRAVGRYRSGQHNSGSISLPVNIIQYYPATETPEDRAAAERALEAMGGWFLEPPRSGDYPAIMRERLGDSLPRFSAEDAGLLAGSLDYVGLNYYLGEFVRHAPGNGAMEFESVPRPEFARTAMGWPIMADGMRDLLHWVGQRFPSMPVYITENGAAFDDEPDADGFVNDQDRIRYLRDHFAAMSAAMAEGVDVRGFLVWSLMDNFEWAHGYTKRFGLIRCEYETLQRTIKASGHWYAALIRSGSLEATEAVAGDGGAGGT
jgi:beta-glucosidase/6-phospho-beta-glucosidase/beta-galactosidase